MSCFFTQKTYSKQKRGFDWNGNGGDAGCAGVHFLSLQMSFKYLSQLLKLKHNTFTAHNRDILV